MSNLKRDITLERWEVCSLIEDGKIEICNSKDRSRICTIQISDFANEAEAKLIAENITGVPIYLKAVIKYLFLMPNDEFPLR